MDTRRGQRRFRVHLLPQTRVGWIAVWCFLAFVATAAVSGAIAATVGGSPLMALFTIPLALSVLGSAAAFWIAVVRRGERGAVLFLPLLLALIALIFVIGEFTSPH